MNTKPRWINGQRVYPKRRFALTRKNPRLARPRTRTIEGKNMVMTWDSPPLFPFCKPRKCRDEFRTPDRLSTISPKLAAYFAR